ncbi:hypothetical protein BH10PSE16_BH10PSE16_35780 [soil metagenome]
MMTRRLALVLLAAAFLAASCGGGDTPSPAGSLQTGSTGTGSIPLYQSSTETLTLPQLRVADNILADVKLLLKKDGSWALVSAGAMRPATAADKPGAALAEPGGNTDLGSTQTDTTLTVPRLHVGTRVFGNVVVRLTGKTWAFASSPQEVKTLHQEDFISNTAIHADESHHVILKSGPDSGVQNVPMQLSSRNYKFCMDAQAEGADSTTLLDAAGTTIFTLKAGDACVTLKAREGAYTLQHRYGGTGSTRTLFLRNQANTTTTALAAARASSTSIQEATTIFPGTEYWSVRQAALDPYQPNFYRYLGIVTQDMTDPYYNLVGSVCADPLTLTYTDQWLSNTFFAVNKSLQFGVPVQLQSSIACNWRSTAGISLPQAEYLTLTGDNTLRAAYPGYYDTFDGPGGSAVSRDIPQTLGITSQNGNQFAIIATAASGASPVIELANGNLAASGVPGDVATPMAVAFRYFPDGLPRSITLGVGQVALFTGTNCSGAAVVAEDISMPSFNANTLPALQGLGTSFQLGLQTSAIAYANPLYLGESLVFDQLTCNNGNNGGFGSTGWTPASMRVVVDTITMVISTDSCEYCNLAGVDFSGISLTNVKLSNANLNGAILSNVDLSGADLRNASLQGAYLINANLDGANLCSAQLNGSLGVAQAATLTGAHLRNTNLALANLDGVRLSSASFYSSNGQGACQQTSCSSYVASTCASAYGASINNASFDSAYLSNVDMSNVKGAGVSFNNAALFGVLFGQADLSHNTVSSVNSSFFNTYLQGTDLSRANLQFAEFTGAQFDAASDCMQTNLNPAYSNFPGGMVLSNSSKPTCVPRKPPAATVCVQSSFTASPGYPKTDCTNICADGSAAGGVVPTNGTCQNTATCSVASWTNTLKVGGNSAMPTSSCLSNPPLCGNAFTSGADPCW